MNLIDSVELEITAQVTEVGSYENQSIIVDPLSLEGCIWILIESE